MLESLFTATLFIFGLLFGSFLNVVIHRLPRAESETSTWWVGYRCLVHPKRSHCPHCGHEIRWFENVPVVSWLALRGKCAGCKAPISPRYVFVELLTGLLFVAAGVRFGPTYAVAPALVLIVLVVPLIFIDAEHWILPFELTLPGIVLGISLAAPLGVDALVSSLLGAAGGYLVFRAMEYLGWLLFRKEALGAGDKFLLALLGAFLGWRPLFGVLFLSSVQGAIFGIANIALRGRAGPATATPEGAPVEDETPDAEFTFTGASFAAGLSFARRLLLVPYMLFLQPIPDDPVETEGEAEPAEWTPGVTALPFGPWIGLAGLEVLLLTPWLRGVFDGTSFSLVVVLLFGES